jgi:hypothetical protein
MNKDNSQHPTATLDAAVSKVKPDLVVLKYLAQQLYITLQQPDSAGTSTEPFRYSLEDCHKRKHRIVLYKPQELLSTRPLSFVGFVSGTRPALNLTLVDEVERIDAYMVAELVNIAGIFSYSSLEVRPGRWYNLVVFHNSETKAHLKNNHTHAYAAYQLAPQYYEWIRLHNGIMPAGLARQELLVQSTKYYTFRAGQQHPDMYEITYERG